MPWFTLTAGVAAGKWDTTVFMLSWGRGDDGDDHPATSRFEHPGDAVPCALGPRVPLGKFGGPDAAGIDSRRNPHVAIIRIVLPLRVLPALGCPRRPGPRPARPGQRPPRRTGPRAAPADMTEDLL